MAGRLIRVEMPRPVGNPPSTQTQTRTFNYHNAINGQIGPWLVSATNPENGTVRYEYFADGRLAARTDNAGIRTTYAYDQVGLTGISYDGTVAATFERGTAAEHAAGRVKNVRYSTDRHSVVETYTYDVYGRVTVKQMGLTGNYVVNGQTYNLTGTAEGRWSYDPEGRLLSATAPGGRQFTWTYNNMGRPGTMQTRPDQNATWTDVVTSATYNVAGLPTQISYTAAYGGPSARGYDPVTFQLTSMDGTTFSYGAAGQNNRQIQSETPQNGPAVVYQYDKLKRLISMGPADPLQPREQTYAYDGFGNMTQRTGGPQPFGPLTINAGTNQIMGVRYTANGAMLTAGAYSLAYDKENRLITATGPGRVLNVAYAPSNQRIYQRETTTTAQETIWFWGVTGKVMAQCGVQATTTALNFTCESDSWAEFGGRRARQNRLGSIGSYYPYGEAKGSGSSFATYQRDAGTGLDYAANRWYSSAYGRFITTDPYRGSGRVRLPSSWNRYSYVLADPMNNRDPLGLDVETAYECEWLESDEGMEYVCYAMPGRDVPAHTDRPVEKKYECNPGYLNLDVTVTDYKGNTFTGLDIDTAAAVIYAEAAGHNSKSYDSRETDVVASVIVNRLRNPLFPGSVDGHKTTMLYTLSDVVNSPGQFESVTGPVSKRKKYQNAFDYYAGLSKAECDDLEAAIDSILFILENGPNYSYTSFRGADATNRGVQIGGNRFWID